MEKRRVGIFDIDGTLFRSSLLVELVESLIDQGVFQKKIRLLYSKELNSWLDRRGSYQVYIDALVKTFRAHIKGVSYADFSETAKIVVARNRYRTYRYTRDLIGTLKNKGYYLLAISHSPKTILEPFCKQLGFDKVYGMLYEIGPQDKFTGETIDSHLILNKATIVRRALEKEHLTLAHSVGVGDTETDISFLEMTSTPICFNPNQKLYRHAKRVGWKVVVERKDVTYELPQ